MKQLTIAQLFPDKSAVPLAAAYEWVTLMERPGAIVVVLKTAKNWLERGGGPHADGDLETFSEQPGTLAPGGADQARVSRRTLHPHDGGTKPQGQGHRGLPERTA